MRLIPVGRRGHFAIIDEEDAHRVSQYSWYLSGHGYAVTRIMMDGKKKSIFLHRFIMEAGPGDIFDHADRIPLNCKKANLRPCSESQNSANRSAKPTEAGYRGVRTEKDYSIVKYRAEFRPLGKKLRGPRRSTPFEAALDYDRMASEHFGAFAVLNFPNGVSGSAGGGALPLILTSEGAL